jgi:two-component system, NtrC family, C4-dicarboxylate transport response regulator DctD
MRCLRSVDSLLGMDVQQLSKALVVVVDDDAAMLQALQRLLHAGGFDSRGFDSVEALRASDCMPLADCLVLDVHLPGQDGPHFYATWVGPKPPAVFISGRAAGTEGERATRAGAQTFLAKPFEGPVFLESVRAAVTARRTS